MMEKEIYILRHGETDLNRQGIIQGSGVDAGLNEKGRQQAQAFFNYYQYIDFEVVMTSALKRTHQTVASFLKLNIPCEQFPDINEIGWGIHEGKQNTSAMHQKFLAVTRAWQAGNFDAKLEGAESANELATRIHHFVEALKIRREKTILVCSHGRAMRCMMCVLKGLHLGEMERVNHANTGLYKVLWNGKGFVFELENDLRHLAGRESEKSEKMRE